MYPISAFNDSAPCSNHLSPSHACFPPLPTESVCVITCDGRSIVGILAGYDQLQNVILKGASERVYSEDSDPEIVPLGLYVIRGDNVAIISDRDEEKEASVKLSEVRAEPLKIVLRQNF